MTKKKKLKIRKSFEVNEIENAIQTYQEKVQEEQEKLLKQTWPIWLKPEQFEGWYLLEQFVRKTNGLIMLPSPPSEVIKNIMENK